MVDKEQRVEAIGEKDSRMEITVEEERSQKIDGSKLFMLANEFGRHVQLGTAGNKLKVIFKWKNEKIKERYEFVGKFIEALQQVDLDETIEDKSAPDAKTSTAK